MQEQEQHHPRFFVSYCVDDEQFVFDTCKILALQFGPDLYPGPKGENMYLFGQHHGPGLEDNFMKEILRQVHAAHCVLVFVGKRFGPYQSTELINAAVKEDKDKALCVVSISGQKGVGDFPEHIGSQAGNRRILFDEYTSAVPPRSVSCAEDIMDTIRDWWRAHFSRQWEDFDEKKLLNGLPRVPQLFDYEKNIIEFYSAKRLWEIPAKVDESKPAPIGNLRLRWPEALVRKRLEDGVPVEWPRVLRYPTKRNNNLSPELAGDFRVGENGGEALVRVAALKGLDPPDCNLTFPEAGPRRRLAVPMDSDRQLNVAILVAGGIAPGINAVIDAIVQRHYVYQESDKSAGKNYRLTLFGVKNGFLAVSGPNAAFGQRLIELTRDKTSEHATRGGSMLGTSRDDELLDPSKRYRRLKEIADALSQKDQMIDILYVIAGDGGMKAAHALWHLASRKRPPDRPLVVVTVPKTMDNDILWVWQSFGFLSAVDESRKIVETLHTEVRSNPRLGIVQFFGSDSGFVVSHAVLASSAGHATLALIPEIKFSAIGVARYLKKRLWETADPQAHSPTSPIDPKLPHGLVVLAENAVPQDALECLGLAELPSEFQVAAKDDLKKFQDAYGEVARRFCLTQTEQNEIRGFAERRKRGLRFEGQTSDVIRKLGLRIMAEALPVFLNRPEALPGSDHFGWPEPDWHKLRVLCSEPRHLVRSLEPSTSDIITGQRLGLLAVDAAMAGYTDCMVSQWLTEFALVPLDLVVLGRKRIPPQGMFWKSVISKTGQQQDLVSPYPCDDQATRR